MILKADFGRDKYSTACDDTYYEGNCTTRVQTEEILKNQCNNKQNCDVVVSTNTFPDPCPNVIKLLRVWYQCVGDGNNLSFSTTEYFKYLLNYCSNNNWR